MDRKHLFRNQTNILLDDENRILVVQKSDLVLIEHVFQLLQILFEDFLGLFGRGTVDLFEIDRSAEHDVQSVALREYAAPLFRVTAKVWQRQSGQVAEELLDPSQTRPVRAWIDRVELLFAELKDRHDGRTGFEGGAHEIHAGSEKQRYALGIVLAKLVVGTEWHDDGLAALRPQAPVIQDPVECLRVVSTHAREQEQLACQRKVKALFARDQMRRDAGEVAVELGGEGAENAHCARIQDTLIRARAYEKVRQLWTGRNSPAGCNPKM